MAAGIRWREMPLAEEWAAAAWAIQGWIRSCFDVTGRCSLCGTGDPHAHINDCPWPQMRALLDRAPLPVPAADLRGLPDV